MSINGVNQNTDIQKLLKLMKANGAQKGAKAQQAKAPGMSMNDSIFSVNKDAKTISSFTNSVKSRGVKNSNPQLSINTLKSVSGMSATQKKAGAEKTDAAQGQKDDNQKVDIGNYDFDNLTQVSTSELQELKSELKELNNSDVPVFLKNGISKKLSKVDAEIDKRSSRFEEVKDEQKTEQKEKDADSSVADSKSSSADAKSGTSQTEHGTQQMNDSASEMKSLNNKMKKDEKTLKKTIKTGEKEIQKTQKKMQKEAQKIQKQADQMTAIGAEIEQLNSRATAEGTSASEKQDIQGQIEAKTASMNAIKVTIGKGNVTLKKLQTTSNKKTRLLARTAKSYRTTANKNINNVKQNSTTADKVLKVANTVDQIGGYTATAGQITGYVGDGMQRAGESMLSNPYTAAAGTALKANGVTVSTVGKTTETVGNYAKCAANVTKAAVYAAQGNIAGALSSAGAAVMSGASAVKGTQQLQKGMDITSKTTQAAGNAAGKAADSAGDAAGKAADSAGDAAGKAAGDAAGKAAGDAAGKAAGDAAGKAAGDAAGKAAGEQMKNLNGFQSFTKGLGDSFSKENWFQSTMQVGSYLQQAGAMIGQNNQNGAQPTQTTIRRTGPMHAQRRRLR